jgi:hypothetical protein
MSRRLSLLPPALLLGVCLVLLPACKKKPTEDSGGGGGDPVGGGGGPPAAVSSDYLLFAQFNAKSVRDSDLFREVKQAVTKAGGTKEWDEAEAKSAAEIGVPWTAIDTATIVVTEAPMRGGPKMVAIITANKPFDKTAILKKEKVTTPDANGFYKVESETWLHFPNDKTLVAVTPELAQQYLNGYAKNPTGWPMTAELTRAASGHTAFAAINTTKIPGEAKKEVEGQFAALTSAQKVVVTANLKGKELSVGVRGTFPDAATATKAKEQVQSLLEMASGFVDMFASGKELAEFGSVKPAVQEAQRAIKAARIDVSGSDVTLAMSYKADFDIGAMVTEAVKKVGEAAGRMKAQNNLKQIGIALHNYESTYGKLPIHGVVANGAPLTRPNDKPLLSWRVALLPYIEQDNLYKQFRLNESWDSPHNKALIEKMPAIFASVEKPGKPGYTHLQMVIGQNAMPTTGMSIVGITDGTSNTIAVIEAAEPVIWTKPDDVMLPAKLTPGELKKKFGGQFPGGFNVVMWDGWVRFVHDTVSERTLSLALNPNDGQVLPADWDPSRPPVGPGPGGVRPPGTGAVPPKGPIPLPPKGPTAVPPKAPPVPPKGR